MYTEVRELESQITAEANVQLNKTHALKKREGIHASAKAERGSTPQRTPSRQQLTS
jgi:hypothetical protein